MVQECMGTGGTGGGEVLVCGEFDLSCFEDDFSLSPFGMFFEEL